MATLFDLAQAYLNRALPKTFRYEPRTTSPTEDTPEEDDVSTERMLPKASGGDNFSVYNPDPNRTRTEDNYSPYNYRQANERSLIGSGDSQFDINKYGTGFRSETELQKFMDMYPDYYRGPQLTGIPGAIAAYAKNSLPGKIIGGAVNFANDMLPVNRRAILENEALGQGIRLNDIGQIVSDGGNINTAENIMAGYNLNKITADTFQKRRDMINEKMKDPMQKAAKLRALDEAEAKILGTAANRADMITEQRLIEEDPSLAGPDYLRNSFNFLSEEDEEDSEIPSFIIDNNITPTGPTYGPYSPTGPTYGPYSPTGPIVTGPTYGPYGGGSGITSVPTAPKTLANKTLNKGFNYLDINPGGGRDDGPSAPPSKTPDYSNVTTAKGPPGQISKPSIGTGSGGLGDYQIQPSKPATNKDYGPYSGGGGGGGGQDSCFLPNTLVTMIDGSTKKIIDVDIGDEVAEGGKVFATGKFLNNELYDYKGVKVSGSHMVNEDGIWMRVRDTKHGKPLGDEEHTVYVFGSENRRILINNILFTDYFEVNEKDKLMNNEEDFFDNWKLYAKQDSGNNVDIINAS